MKKSVATVQSYYDSDPEHEWQRLDRGRFEMPITMHYLQKYLPDRSSVLDVGGGPGRYSIALAKLGHTVDILDLSSECISLAKRKAEQANVRLNGFHTGTCTDLSRFPAESFDAVLCMGPLYHLTDSDDRQTAVLQCLRVLKPSGLFVASFLSSYAHVFDLVCIDIGLIRDYDPWLLAKRCVSSSFEGDKLVFTDSHYIEPFEVATFMGKFSLEQLSIIGAQGLTGQSQAAIARTDPEVLHKWIELGKALAESNGAIGSSIHIAYFGRKL